MSFISTESYCIESITVNCPSTVSVPLGVTVTIFIESDFLISNTLPEPVAAGKLTIEAPLVAS